MILIACAERLDCVLVPSGPAELPSLGLDDARHLLLQDYQAHFSKVGPALPPLREGTIGSGRVYPLGSFFPLEGFDEVVKQMLRRLLKLNSSFIPDNMFMKTLQLLRLVAAPGMGKVGLACFIYYGPVLVIFMLSPSAFPGITGWCGKCLPCVYGCHGCPFPVAMATDT